MTGFDAAIRHQHGCPRCGKGFTCFIPECSAKPERECFDCRHKLTERRKP